MTDLTAEGLEKLKKELERLKTVERKEMAERLKHAISFGDLSENAAYHEAKEAQGFLEGKILELEKTLREARVIQEHADKTIVRLGSRIAVLLDEEKINLEIVGPNETDPTKGRISGESPFGAELLGKKRGQSGKIKIRERISNYKIVEIS